MRPCPQCDENLLAAVHHRRLSSHSPECQGPLNQITLLNISFDCSMMPWNTDFATYKIFFEEMASCLLAAERLADEQSSLSPAVKLKTFQIGQICVNAD